jgi:hypothetical protein
MDFLRSSPVFLEVVAIRTNCFQQSCFEMNRVLRFVTLKLIANLHICHAPGSPAAVHLLETRSFESLPRLIAKNEVSFCQRTVLPFIPSFPDREIPEKVLGRIRTQRNRHQRIKMFARLVEVRIRTLRYETKFDSSRKAADTLRDANEFGDSLRLNVGKGDYRGRGRSSRYIGKRSTK